MPARATVVVRSAQLGIATGPLQPFERVTNTRPVAVNRMRNVHVLVGNIVKRAGRDLHAADSALIGCLGIFTAGRFLLVNRSQIRLLFGVRDAFHSHRCLERVRPLIAGHLPAVVKSNNATTGHADFSRRKLADAALLR